MTQGILLVNKPIGLSSFDLIRVFKRVTSFKGKIGHAGTLDVFANGLMILMINTTKYFANFQTLTKHYQAGIRLGLSSETLDIEGNPSIQKLDIYPTREAIQALIESFITTYDQTVPIYSAAKQDGKALYELARTGQVIIPKSKSVTIAQITLLGYKYPLVNLEVTCSSGTYIRQLTFDIFKTLEIDSLLFSLTRTQIGDYHLKNAIEIKDFAKFDQHLLTIPTDQK